MSVYVTAEIGSNWEPGNLESALRMVELAAACGVDGIKFQDFNPLSEMNRPPEWKERCKSWELPTNWHDALKEKAQACGIDYYCSVFTEAALERALPSFLAYWTWTSAGDFYYNHPDGNEIVKVASSEITNQDLLRKIGKGEGPVVHLSLGEIKHPRQVSTAISRLSKCDIVLLACVAQYPVKRPLDLMDELIFAQTFGLPVGISSHIAYGEELLSIVRSAVKRGIVAAEFHLRAEWTLEECPDNGLWALLPDELKKVVGVIRG